MQSCGFAKGGILTVSAWPNVIMAKESEIEELKHQLRSRAVVSEPHSVGSRVTNPHETRVSGSHESLSHDT